MVHAYPYYTHGLSEFCTATGEFRLGNALGEMLDVTCSRIQLVGTVTLVREPDEPVAVDEETRYFTSDIRHDFGFLSVGIVDNLTRLGAEEDVITIGGQLGDLLIQHDTFLL